MSVDNVGVDVVSDEGGACIEEEEEKEENVGTRLNKLVE